MGANRNAFSCSIIVFIIAEVENAAPNKLTANVNVNLNVTGVTTNDYLSFLPSSTIGCNTAASATSFTLSDSAVSLVISIPTAGTYKVCHALASSGGNSNDDFVELKDIFTVQASMATIVIESEMICTSVHQLMYK